MVIVTEKRCVFYEVRAGAEETFDDLYVINKYDGLQNVSASKTRSRITKSRCYRKVDKRLYICC
jgi:hypothetical protein